MKKETTLHKLVKEELSKVQKERLNESFGWSELAIIALIAQTIFLTIHGTLPKLKSIFKDAKAVGGLRNLYKKMQHDKIFQPILQRLAADPDVREYIQSKGTRGIRKVIYDKLTDEEKKYAGQVYGKDIVATIEKADLDKTFEGVIKEESQKRYVATMEFYVWAPGESAAKKEAEAVVTTVSHKYDNSPQITGLVPQQFGKLGIGEGKLKEPFHTPEVLRRLQEAERLLDVAKNNLPDNPVKQEIEEFLKDRMDPITWV